MFRLLVLLAICSGASFLFYGYQTLFVERRTSDFNRYGLSGFRLFVGIAEVLGGAGVLVGLAVAPIGVAAAGGLCTMTVLAIVVRFRIGDSLRLMLPAIVFSLINALLIALFLPR